MEEGQIYRYSDIAEEQDRHLWRIRLRGFTFAWFTICMATAGLSYMLKRIPPRYACAGTETFGSVILVFDIVLFVVFCAFMAFRFIQSPRSFITMLRHPVESSYLCAFAQAISTQLVVIADYGIPETGPWLKTTLLVCVFCQIVFVVALTVALPLVQLDGRKDNLAALPTSWFLMPTLTTYIGTLGTVLLDQLPASQAIYLFWISYAVFGIGFFIAIFYFSLWIVRQVVSGLFKENYILSPFMLVGTSSYMAGGFLAFGESSKRLFAEITISSGQPYLTSEAFAGNAFSVMHLSLGCLLYGLTWWLFFLSIAMTATVLIRQGRKAWSPGVSALWSTQFPTTGLIVVTWDVSRSLAVGDKANGPRWLDIIGIVLLFIWVAGYIMAAAVTIQYVWQGKLLWEGKDDNKPALHYHGEFEAVKTQ